jgi:two-component system response regulator FixJ
MSDVRPLVFVVDDDKAVRDSLKFELELEGLEVQPCACGGELLAHDRLAQAVCLVIDYQMPLMDGFELVAELRRRSCHTPVILITGQVTGWLRRRARTMGLRPVIEKPLLDSALLETLQSVLKSRP